MHPSVPRHLAIITACACLLSVLMAPYHARAQQFADDLDPVTFYLSPETPNDTFPKANQENRLAPGTKMLITVNIAKTGQDKGHNYELSGEPEFTAAVDVGIAEHLWTRTDIEDSADLLVVEFLLTNASPVFAQASLAASCVWTPVTGYGGGTGPRPDDIYGTAFAQVYLEQPVVDWTFDRLIAVYNLVDHLPEDRQIPFTASFRDTAGRLLSSDQITAVSFSFVGDPPATQGGGLQPMGSAQGSGSGLYVQITEHLESFTNYIRAYIDAIDPDQGGSGTPEIAFNDRDPEAPEDGEAVAVAPLLLVSDLTNDGQIDNSDIKIIKSAAADNSTPTEQQLAREYMFVNDHRSNGVHDIEDLNAPSGTQQDDDAKRIRIVLKGITDGRLWLEHSRIDNLAFYEDAACETPIEFPIEVEAVDFLGSDIFMRAEGEWTEEVKEDLRLKYSHGQPNETIGEARLNLTVVSEIGDPSYFMAARDYMLEHNSRVHVRYIGENEHEIRILTMRHEATVMKVVETYHRNPKLYGIDAVVHQNQGAYDVIINGNFCYFPGNRMQRAQAMLRNEMTPRCHGLLITNGAMNPAGSTGGVSPLEGPLAKYIASSGNGTIEIRQGVVPNAPIEHDEALGGLAGNLVGGTAAGYNIHPWYGIAHTGEEGAEAKVLFMVTQGNRTSRYNVEDLVQRLKDSGCPPLPANPAQIMCVAGDGGSSSAFAYRLEGGPVAVRLKGSKHEPNAMFQGQGRYWINTYLAFQSELPR